MKKFESNKSLKEEFSRNKTFPENKKHRGVITVFKFNIICDELCSYTKIRDTNPVEFEKHIIETTFNPKPYFRRTQGSKFSQESRKYHLWELKVFRDFENHFKQKPCEVFKKRTKYHLYARLFFKDKKHGDPDNCSKSITDAIFKRPLNDKNITTRNNYFYVNENPRAEVIIVPDIDKDRVIDKINKWLDNEFYILKI